MKTNAGRKSPLHPVGPYLDPLRLYVRRKLQLLPPPVEEFILFGLKQAWACLFAGLLLFLLVATKIVWQPDWLIHRYDALFAAAILIQAAFLFFRLETWSEVKVIFIYHFIGTVMELFKTSVGSWSYPEEALIRIAGVPLFTGFMYAAVGSYMVRVMRIFDMRFTSYPPLWMTVTLAVAIYANFYLHHYIVDLRWLLFVLSAALFWRVRIYYTVNLAPRWMPLLLAAFLTAFFLWAAENIGTYTGTWLYPSQTTWHLVSVQKLGSWFLLSVVSFVIVTLINPPAPLPDHAQ